MGDATFSLAGMGDGPSSMPFAWPLAPRHEPRAYDSLRAGDWHGIPVLFERALQRKAWCVASFEEEGSVVAVIGDLYGYLAAPYHGVRDDGCDVLHGDLLLAIAAVAVERLGKPRESSRSLVSECQPRACGSAPASCAVRCWFHYQACRRRDRGALIALRWGRCELGHAWRGTSRIYQHDFRHTDDPGDRRDVALKLKLSFS